MCSNDSGLWCWDATTQVASDDAPSQRRGWSGVLSFSFEVRVRQGRVTLPCKSLRGVRAPNSYAPFELQWHSQESALQLNNSHSSMIDLPLIEITFPPNENKT